MDSENSWALIASLSFLYHEYYFYQMPDYNLTPRQEKRVLHLANRLKPELDKLVRQKRSSFDAVDNLIDSYDWILGAQREAMRVAPDATHVLPSNMRLLRWYYLNSRYSKRDDIAFAKNVDRLSDVRSGKIPPEMMHLTAFVSLASDTAMYMHNPVEYNNSGKKVLNFRDTLTLYQPKDGMHAILSSYALPMKQHAESKFASSLNGQVVLHNDTLSDIGPAERVEDNMRIATIPRTDNQFIYEITPCFPVSHENFARNVEEIGKKINQILALLGKRNSAEIRVMRLMN